MKFWISKNSEVPVRQQIITQITLGITSGDLPVGERLPSTQEIARRFRIHPNTVSGAYQILADQGWIEFKKGSGFYVCEPVPEEQRGELGLDGLIAEFLKKAHGEGFSKSEIQARVAIWFSSEKPREILVIDSDSGLREILVGEIRQATDLPVRGTDLDGLGENYKGEDLVLVAMSDEKSKVERVLPAGKNCFYLNSRSVSDAMEGQERPRTEDLIAVVSGWDAFLMMAKTMLLAAQIDSDSLIVRSTSENEWQKGLNAAAMIICDSLTADEIGNKENVRTFQIIADDSLRELKEMVF